jgi:hypothetical protein
VSYAVASDGVIHLAFKHDIAFSSAAAGGAVPAGAVPTPAAPVEAEIAVGGAAGVVTGAGVVLTAAGGGAADVEDPLHPADMTTRQAPQTAAATGPGRTRASTRTPMPRRRPADPEGCT